MRLERGGAARVAPPPVSRGGSAARTSNVAVVAPLGYAMLATMLLTALFLALGLRTDARRAMS